MHAFYLTGAALGLAVAISVTAIPPFSMLAFCAAWNFYDGICAFADAYDANNKSQLANNKSQLANNEKVSIEKKRKRVNIASGLFLIGGTIAAVAMITNPLAPVIMAAVFSFAMFCSFFNRKYDTGKYNSPNGPGDTNLSFLGASDGEASKSLLRGRIKLTDKKSWALCIIGMTAVAVMTGLGSMGTIPAVVVAGFALLSAIYRVANSYYNKKAQTSQTPQAPFMSGATAHERGSPSFAPAEPPLDHP